VAVALALPVVLARWPAPGGSSAHPAPIEVAIVVQAPPPGAGPITPPGLKSLAAPAQKVPVGEAPPAATRDAVKRVKPPAAASAARQSRPQRVREVPPVPPKDELPVTPRKARVLPRDEPVTPPAPDTRTAPPETTVAAREVPRAPMPAPEPRPVLDLPAVAVAPLAPPVPEVPLVPAPPVLVSVPAEDEPTASPPVAGTGERSGLQGLPAAQGDGEALGAATALSTGGQAAGAGAHVEAASGARSGGVPDVAGSDGRPGASFGVVGNGLFVRPLGGYQVRPRYPESARQQRIEGTTLLRARVTERGRVETVEVERSAGHRDLDRSAADAVRRWRFDPARRGEEPVAVWVLIPVKFELR
jgi:protein TonB